MKQSYEGIANQAVAIFLSAAAAAMFTFLQVLVSSTGACPPVESTTTEAGILGATFKGLHTAFLAMTHRNFL